MNLDDRTSDFYISLLAMFLKYIIAKLWEYGMGECEIEGGIMNIVVPIYDPSDTINLYSDWHTLK